MKSQRKHKECELSFCRLPTAAVAHRIFIARQQRETFLPQQDGNEGQEKRGVVIVQKSIQETWGTV